MCPPPYTPRLVDRPLADLFAQLPALLIVGPRATGKTTSARRLARSVVRLDVPAEAEIVLEGYVDPAEKRVEGPFGDHTGYYSLADEYPVFHLTCLTRPPRSASTPMRRWERCPRRCSSTSGRRFPS